MASTINGMTLYHWPVDPHCLPEPKTPQERTILQEAINTAGGILWAFTGRRFGIHPAMVRPCPPHSAGVCSLPADASVVTCSRNGGILLPGPVHKITRFEVGGHTISLEGLTLHGNILYRVGGAPWPDQNLSIPPSVPGGWAIHYERGEPIPPGGAHAVGLLAKEFFAACTGGRCALPRRVQQVQRQGVTVSAVDPADIFAAGATGIPEVDLWIKAHNPHRLQAPAEVWSPDVPLW